MNKEVIKREYMEMYDSLVAKIDNELKKLTESTFFVDSISFNIVDNVIKMDVNSLLERSKIIISSDNVSDDERKIIILVYIMLGKKKIRYLVMYLILMILYLELKVSIFQMMSIVRELTIELMLAKE